MTLATVAIAAAATTINAGNITDLRPIGRIGQGSRLDLAKVGAEVCYGENPAGGGATGTAITPICGANVFTNPAAGLFAVEMFCPQIIAGAGIHYVHLMEGVVDLGYIAEIPASTRVAGFHVTVRVSLAAGARYLQMAGRNAVSMTTSYTGGAGGAGNRWPMFVRATRIQQ